MAQISQSSTNGKIKETVEQDDDDSDWEYEYHETETETFNVILDFSSSSDMRRRPKRNDLNTISAQKANPQNANSADRPSLEAPTDASVSDRIQILDLHTSNPLISYQSQLYTCNWTTTIGTDMILSPDIQDPSPLLFTTRHKILARPAGLIPRASAPNSSSSPPSHSLASSAPTNTSLMPNNNINDQTSSSVAPTTKPSIIPLDTHASLAKQSQTAFLEQLMAAKAARGETDQVTVYSQRRMTGTGWRSRRKAAAMEEEEVEAEVVVEAEAEVEVDAVVEVEAGVEAEAEAEAEADPEADPDAEAEADQDPDAEAQLKPQNRIKNLSTTSKPQKRSQPQAKNPKPPKKARIGRPRRQTQVEKPTKDTLFGPPQPLQSGEHPTTIT